MSRPISSYPERQRIDVANRREASQTRGLGYWAAIDAKRKLAALAHAAKLARERAA